MLKIILFISLLCLFGCSHDNKPYNIDLSGMTFCSHPITDKFIVKLSDDNNYFSSSSIFCPNITILSRNINKCDVVFKRPNSELIGMVFIKENSPPPTGSLFFANVILKNCSKLGVNKLFLSQNHPLPLDQGYSVFEAYYVE